ncbi:hypothetical protein N9D70_01580 [bacterium]|nr:hypothetical protein [bacterium]
MHRYHQVLEAKRTDNTSQTLALRKAADKGPDGKGRVTGHRRTKGD